MNWCVSQFLRVCYSFFNYNFLFGNLEQRIFIYYAIWSVIHSNLAYLTLFLPRYLRKYNSVTMKVWVINIRCQICLLKKFYHAYRTTSDHFPLWFSVFLVSRWVIRSLWLQTVTYVFLGDELLFVYQLAICPQILSTFYKWEICDVKVFVFWLYGAPDHELKNIKKKLKKKWTF